MPFELSVVDLNDSPRLIIPSSDFINVDTSARSTVVVFSTLDDDSRDFHRYTLSGDVLDNDLFFLYGNKLKLQPGVDLADQSSYAIRVVSSDFDGASIEQDLEFSLNHPPESIELSTSDLPENLPLVAKFHLQPWILISMIVLIIHSLDLVRRTMMLQFKANVDAGQVSVDLIPA